jgi:hypothetical protein
MRKRNVALVAMAAGIIATATWVAPAIGEEVAIVVDRGVARLQLTAAGDKITYDPLSGSDQVQELGVSTGCTLSTSGDSVMIISASSVPPPKSPPVPGLKDHRLGVGQKGEGTGEPCARINEDLGQALTLTLDLGPNMAMDYAEIDINFKYNGEAGWRILYKGAQVGAGVLPCSGSDCGPDSGADDNKRLKIGNFATTGERMLFDQIELTATTPPPNGAISVEGGQDPDDRGPLGLSLNTYDSLFRVVEVFDGELNCGEGFDEEDGGVVGTFFRLDNAPPPLGQTGPPCTPKPYNAEASAEDGTIYFAPSGSDQDARYRGTLTLGNRSAANPFTSNLKYDPEDDGSFKDMPWCGSVIYDGEPPGVIDPVVIDAAVPDGDTWCITGESTVVASPGFVTTTWSVFGYGDPKFR